MHVIFRFLTACLLLHSLLLVPALATEEYAVQTGRDCAACHVDPAGGGELTAAGVAYQAFLYGPESQAPQGEFSLLRLVAGYLHLFFAFFWFGTILYVHLVLKPAYAVGGLPKGEVRVGLIGMLVTGLSGAVLMAYRVPSHDMLLNTRFGILLLIKVGLYCLMVLSALFVVLVIGPKLRRERQPAAAPGDATGDLTPDQLAACDGKEGRPSRIAHAGNIYDPSQSKLWPQGTHFKRHNCGEDLSEAMAQAPHGPEVLERLPRVGRLVPTPQKTPMHQRVFFFMAYMNLSFVLVILLIIALWKWL